MVRRIALHNSSEDIFRSVVQNAVENTENTETATREFIDDLCSNEDLIDVSIYYSEHLLFANQYSRRLALYLDRETEGRESEGYILLYLDKT